jgi:hypothetical protein
MQPQNEPEFLSLTSFWGRYSQQFIFFVTLPNKLDRVLHYTILERLARKKYSSLLGLFESFVENEVFANMPPGL